MTVGCRAATSSPESARPLHTYDASQEAGAPGDYGHLPVDGREVLVLAGIAAGFVPLLTDDLEGAGDALQITLPATAALATALERDWQGTGQLAGTFATAWGTTYGLKFVLEKWRPSASNDQSFPSGHTMGAFVGASFLNRRYGPLFGIPAYAGAILTGLSRIESEAHFGDDVLAGASFALFSNWYWTTPYATNVEVQPIVVGDGVGLGVTFNGPDLHRPARNDEPFRPRGRYRLYFGWASELRNEVTAPAAGGTTLDFSDFDDLSDPLVTASAELELYVAEHDEVVLRFFPFEVRDRGVLESNASFAGREFAAGETMTGYVLYDVRAAWRRALVRTERWSARAGAGLVAHYTRASLSQSGAMIEAEDWSAFPYATGQIGYHATPVWTAYLDGDVGGWDDASSGRASVGLRYQLDRNWELGLEYQILTRDLDSSDLKNDLDLHAVLLALGCAF